MQKVLQLIREISGVVIMCIQFSKDIKEEKEIGVHQEEYEPEWSKMEVRWEKNV